MGHELGPGTAVTCDLKTDQIGCLDREYFVLVDGKTETACPLTIMYLNISSQLKGLKFNCGILEMEKVLPEEGFGEVVTGGFPFWCLPFSLADARPTNE